MKTRGLFLLFLLLSAVGVYGQGALSASAPAPQGKQVAAYLDINFIFKNHPWTALTKETLTAQLKEKADEIERVKKEISALKDETKSLENFADDLKPFYEISYSGKEGIRLPLTEKAVTDERADAIVRNLVFSGADIRFNSPVDSVLLLEENNKKINAGLDLIHQKEVYVEQLRFETKNRIRGEEAVEAQEILEDIYEELKLYAMKRNIAIIVNKTDILYGQKPFDITQDFVERLRKTKKEKKSKKDSKKTIVIELDGQRAPEINKGKD